MKLNILRLGSVIREGVGEPDAGSIDLIYSFFLQEYKCDYYDHIHINQIGDDLEEVILKAGRKIHINIKYPVKDFDKRSLEEKNLIRLDVVHTALLRIAEKEKKLDVNSLIKIRNHILDRNFVFDFVFKQYEEKKNQVVGKILIHPLHDRFRFYFSAEKNNMVTCKILVYEGKCTDYYITAIFYSGKWKGSNLFIIKDKNKEIELHVFVEEDRVELINHTKYRNPPLIHRLTVSLLKQPANKPVGRRRQWLPCGTGNVSRWSVR